MLWQNNGLCILQRIENYFTKIIRIMKKEKVYISGSISGIDRRVYINNFATAEQELLSLGYKVVNPTKVFVCRYIWLYYCMEKLFGKTWFIQI